MSKPEIAAKHPQSVDVKQGETYYWCACGRSDNQPWCDGSHQGTEFEPQSFTPDQDETAVLCLCKRTQNPPYCDGSHASLDASDNDDASDSKDTGNGMPKAKPTDAEPTVAQIHALARDGLEQTGPHGEMVAMGVPRTQLPAWDDLQIRTAQFATKPLLDGDAVDTELVIGPNAKKPLVLNMPLLVSDMSFGALSEEAKIALARGAQAAGTGICSGEGGMLPEEQAENDRYLYELASAKFGYDESQLENVQAFHFKGGQAAKTGTGGHLPAAKVTGKIAEVRGLREHEPAVSPATFTDLRTTADFRKFADRVREVTGGIPVGMKMSANHIEQDIDFALESGVDYIILDGRGGGTGAAPRLFRDHISIPTIPALARARRHLDARKRSDVTLIVTGGLRLPQDFAKALCLGADGIALANSAMQAVGCVAARICNTNQCPAGIATQKPELRAKLDVDRSAQQLTRFLNASVQLMQVLARACGHRSLTSFSRNDLTTWHTDMARLAGVDYAGVRGPGA